MGILRIEISLPTVIGKKTKGGRSVTILPKELKLTIQKTLIVEDNGTFRKTFKDALEKRFPGLTVEEAEDGGQALEKVESFRPDLVFMDIRLPGASGLELTEKIKERHPEILVFILTEYDLPEYHEAACFGGADEFISKGSLNLPDIAGRMGKYAEDRER